MVSLKNIQTGNRVEITLEGSSGKKVTYTSLVEENYNDGRLLLYIPMMYGKIIKLPVDEEYSFSFVTETGILKYNAIIKEYVYLDDFNFMVVEVKDELEKVQRREFFRFDCVLPLKFIKLSDDLTEESNEGFFEGTVKDLGEGGIRFLSNEELKIGDKVKFLITLNYKCAVASGEIMHKQEYPKSNFKYQYRTQFFDLNAEEREKIIDYIFFEQRFKARKDRELSDDEN